MLKLLIEYLKDEFLENKKTLRIYCHNLDFDIKFLISALTSNHFKKSSIIGSAHSFKEVREKIKSKCSIIFLSPILNKNTGKLRKPIGIIKFLLISQHFKKVTFYPLGGIYSPLKLRAYGIKGFAGIEYFNKKS
jgi:thiamine monophosphate synthase